VCVRPEQFAHHRPPADSRPDSRPVFADGGGAPDSRHCRRGLTRGRPAATVIARACKGRPRVRAKGQAHRHRHSPAGCWPPCRLSANHRA